MKKINFIIQDSQKSWNSKKYFKLNYTKVNQKVNSQNVIDIIRPRKIYVFLLSIGILSKLR